MAYLSAYYSTGSTVVAVIRDSSLQFADVENEVMEDYDDGDITDYDTACTEVGSTGEYYFTWPDWLSAGQYTVQFLPLAGATIAESDMLNRFSVSSWYWDGTNLMPDWAAKIAGVASPVSDSIEDRVKGVKTKTDGLNFTGTDVKATLDSETVTLAATGLDNISAAEPTAKPTTFAGWVMWLVQRFRASTMTSATLTVTKEDGTTVTTQDVSDDGTTQTLGGPS